MFNVHLVKKSRNSKVGGIPVTTTDRKSCPDSCPLNNGQGCYAQAGYYTRLNWDKVSRGERGKKWGDFLEDIKNLKPGQLWRHNIAGDLPGSNDTIDADKLNQLADANKDKNGFTYTHYPATKKNLDAVSNAVRKGFTINLSANNLQQAINYKKKTALPVAAMVPSDYGTSTREIDGEKVIVCPATYKDNVSCATCKLCSIADRDSIIAFPAHGAKAKQADLIATNGGE